MAKDSSGQEKTEEATPRRRQEMREKGQVSKSADFNGAVTLLAMLILFYFYKDNLIINIQSFLRRILSTGLTIEFNQDNLSNFLFSVTIDAFKLLFPIFILAMVIGAASNLIQVGFMLSPKVLKPQIERLNPIEGFKKFITLRSLVELFKSIIKLLIVGGVTYAILTSRISDLFYLTQMHPVQIFQEVSSFILFVMAGSTVAYLVLALLDFFYQRYEYNKSIRMTKKEIKDEMKQTEGDPLIKGKQRQKQREMSASRMLKDVPEASVVITNPTHFAVALKYEDGVDQAPIITAKGADRLAKRIREIAEEHQIPVFENKEVARFIYSHCEIGDMIPVEVFHAVAEILAEVYRLKK